MSSKTVMRGTKGEVDEVMPGPVRSTHDLKRYSVHVVMSEYNKG